MLQSNKNFIKYYDKLFLSKDYSKETNYILDSFNKFAEIDLNNILDLGCGTGAHTLEFFKLGYKISGLDLDKQMIELAQSKSHEVDFIYGDIKTYSFQNRFELIFSFFNVLNYIGKLTTMRNFLEGVCHNLEKGGVFIFDGWNGNRIPVDPPQNKDIIISEKDFYAKGVLYPNYDAFNNQSKFKYVIDINDNEHIVKYENELPQTYWSPFILKELLSETGFKEINIFANLTFKKAQYTDYKLSWVCKK